MKLVQCDRFKNHYYDGDKFTTCPHCAKLGLGNGNEKKKSFFSKNDNDNSPKESVAPATDKTVMLTELLDNDQLDDVNAPVGVSGSIEDIKTVAMYGFEDETEPVVGWLVAVSGNCKGKSYTLKSGKNSVGRSGAGSEVDLDLDGDHTISRGSQAVVIYEPKSSKYLLQTTDGSSLVYLNEELLMTFTEIKAYDKITIGESDLLFVPFCGDKFKW